MTATAADEAPTEFLIEGDGRVADLSAAQLEDASTFAKQHNRPVDEVIAGFVGQDEFVDAANAIQTRFPGAYSSSRWESATATGEIAFVAEPPAGALDLIKVSGVSVLVRLVGGVSEQHIVANQALAYMAVYTLPGVANATAGVDPETGTIDVQFLAEPGLSVAAVTSLQRTASQVARTALTDQKLDLVVTHEPKLGGQAELTRGGMSYGGCTGAFSIRSGSSWGIASARHCSTVSTYDGYAMGSAGFPAPVADGDVRWQATAGVGASRSFRYTFTAYRSVTAVSNPVVGDNICKFGRTTGYTCDSTYLLNKCANGYCGMNFTLGEQAQGGDSGGPYFNGTTARGIHHGEYFYNGAWRDVYTRIGVVNLTNATVITSGP